MSSKVAPLPLDTVPLGNATSNSVKRERRSRVYRALLDVYEYYGWTRVWLAVLWCLASVVSVRYRYPSTAGTFHSMVKSQMTAYQLPDGTTADVRSVTTFADGLTHALGFLTVFSKHADNEVQPEGVLPVTEYDRIIFARLDMDFKSNCLKKYALYGFNCYNKGVDPVTGSAMDPDLLAKYSGSHGHREVELLDRNVTRDEMRTRIQEMLDPGHLLFVSTYAFKTSLLIGVMNGQAGSYVTAYYYTVSRKTSDAIGSQSMRSVVVKIDNLDLRDTPLYIMGDDFVRAPLEIISVLFLLAAIWDEVVQFNMCRAWRNLHLRDEQRQSQYSRWRRALNLTWFFFSQPWNILDLLAILNYVAYWILFLVLMTRSYRLQVRTVRTLVDYEEVEEFAQLHVEHLVWGVFTSILVGLRVVPWSKTQPGINIYSLTLEISYNRLKDLLAFFGYVFFLMAVLISPLFEITGANSLFRDTGTSIVALALITFQYVGFFDFFNYNAPTFGSYWIIFMFFFAVCVLILVVISQNVLLALVASAYDEAREIVGAVELTQFSFSLYRIWWMGYSRMHRWLLRKSPYDLAESLMADTSRADVGFYRRLFARWALADLPEARVLAQLFTEPASEIMYMYSPWAWLRSSPWDDEQQAPWDEQLNYPMYSWDDVPCNEPGVRPRLRRLPPLFSRAPADGHPTSRGKLPVAYSEADELFAMSEQEVDDLLDCVDWCWGRMRRYAIVRLSGLGWSERGRAVLREGLLTVYRRHAVSECTSTAVCGDAGGRSRSGSLVAVEEPATPGGAFKSVGSSTRLLSTSATTGGVRLPDGAPAGANANIAPEAGADPAATCAGGMPTGATAMQRNRQFSLFNRRGRISESLDMLWGEISELRQQQSVLMQQHTEIKVLMELLLRQQQQLQPAAAGHQQSPQQQLQQQSNLVRLGLASRSADGDGGLARGLATLSTDVRRPVGAPGQTCGPWEPVSE